MKGKYHIAVLECDTPVERIQTRYGTYGDIFERLLKRGLAGLKELPGRAGDSVDVELALSKWLVVDNQIYPNPDDVDAILLTGSKHNAFGTDDWIVNLTGYVRDVVNHHPQMRVVGICFGHQIIGRALGARVGRSPEGWEIAVDEINLTETGKELFGKEVLSLHQMHRDIVYEVPKGCLNLGYSSRCQVQGLYWPKRLLAVQGHPEFDEFMMDQIIEARYEQKIFDDQFYRDGKSRAGLSHDGVLVGSVIWRLLLDCR